MSHLKYPIHPVRKKTIVPVLEEIVLEVPYQPVPHPSKANGRLPLVPTVAFRYGFLNGSKDSCNRCHVFARKSHGRWETNDAQEEGEGRTEKDMMCKEGEEEGKGMGS